MDLVRIGLTSSLLLITLALMAQPAKKGKIKSPLTKNKVQRPAKTDTLITSTGKDTIPKKVITKDTLVKPLVKDSTFTVVDTFSIANLSKDSLEAPIDYAASDSGVLDIPGKKFYLYGKAKTKYQTMDLSAGVIELDNENQTVKAFGVKDEKGEVVDKPLFKDGEMESQSDSMFYNMRNQKGLTKSTYTKQGEMYVYADRIKKISGNEYYAARGRFTTCNLDEPHFAFRTKKMKLVNNKWAYSGMAYPEFEGVPLPIGIPFGIYPLSQGRHSGMLAPSFSATQFFGLGLEGLGYYKVINPYFDVTLRTNIYSYGGFMINVIPTYRKRYRFNGGINLTFQSTKINFKGDPDYSKTKTYSFNWRHSVDSKARPGTSFSANVNISSSKFNRLVPNNTIANFTNQLNSAIQYSKVWQQGKYNLQVSATHSQNNSLGLFNINLPNLNFNATTFFPFKKEETIGEEKWYEKLGISYSGQLQNQLAFYDTVQYGKNGRGSLLKHLLDTAQWGATHSIPFTLSLPQVGPFQLSPGFSYNEKWYGQENLKKWNNTTKKLDTITNRGFFAAREMQMSLSLQTGIFGTFNFKKGNLVAIRHTIRPNVSINYKPDLVKRFYYDTQVDTTGRKVRFSTFDGSLVGGFGEGRFGGMSFGINQQVEAKVKDKSDTTGKGTKKIRIIDNFSINSGYNFFADTCKLSDISINFGTVLFEKINISANTSIIPYVVDNLGRRTRTYAWAGKNFSFGSINYASIAISTSLQSKTKDNKKTASIEAPRTDYYNPDEDQMQREYVRNHPAEFTDFNVPWSLNVNMAINFNKTPKADYSGLTTTTSASMNLNGDFSLTPKWKMGGSGYYDLTTMKLAQFTMFITREMHCWQMSINVTPIGLFPSFNITINPKSGILRDLKINRTRTFQTVL